MRRSRRTAVVRQPRGVARLGEWRTLVSYTVCAVLRTSTGSAPLLD